GLPAPRRGGAVLPRGRRGPADYRRDRPLARLQGPAETDGEPGAAPGFGGPMNCEACQRRLLASEDPEAPAAEVRAHLAGCPACRRWQRQLLRLERHVPLLPV